MLLTDYRRLALRPEWRPDAAAAAAAGQGLEAAATAAVAADAAGALSATSDSGGPCRYLHLGPQVGSKLSWSSSYLLSCLSLFLVASAPLQREALSGR